MSLPVIFLLIPLLIIAAWYAGSYLTAAKKCRWRVTGHSKGRFVEYRCRTCGADGMTLTGKPPLDCKKAVRRNGL